MTARSRFTAVLVLVVAAGWLLRVWPALSFGDWWRVPADYDDAVYFVASALLWRGELPYRDFVFVHPPGLVLFLAPIAGLVSAVGAAQAFSLARWLMTLVGAANIALSARVANRAGGPVAAAMAVVVYAVSPEAVLHERSTYLEPALNLACLLLADHWLAIPAGSKSRARAIGAGLALGTALTIKAWAVAWVVACVIAAPTRAVGAANAGFRLRALPDWGSLRNLAFGAALSIGVLAMPFLIAAPGPFVEQTVVFQLARPLDGMGRLERSSAMLLWSWPITLLALAGLVTAMTSRDETRRRTARFFGVAWVLAVVAFLLGPSFWPDYNSHLAAAVAPLAGLGAAWLWTTAAARGRGAQAVIAALLIASPLVPLRRAIVEARVGGDLMERIGAQVRAIPTDECYLPFEPLWSLAGDRLPSMREGQPPLVDAYATMLFAARGGERERRFALEAMHRRAAQERIRELLAGCEHLSLGQRGRLQLTSQTMTWIARRWEEVEPASETGIDVWRLRR